MLESVLFFIHYAILMLFGLLLSFAFSGITLSNKKNIEVLIFLFVISGLMQLCSLYFFDELFVWKIYPFITHFPLLLVLCFGYRKRLMVALASLSSAYLCCQPAKWMGILCLTLTDSYIIEQTVRLMTLFVVGFIAIYYLSPILSILFNKDTRSVCIFGLLPLVYYVFDYTMGIYTNFWTSNNRLSVEFLPFFLCIIFIIFCNVYYREYEQKSDAERREQIISIAIEQQEKEIKAVKRSEQEIRLLRHDMRLFLNNLSTCIEDQNYKKAQELLSSYSSHIEGTKVEKFCGNDTINYVLSDFAAKCISEQIVFHHIVELNELTINELLFSSTLSNILDNALNAQADVAKKKRHIQLMLKQSDHKLLLSVKNTYGKKPEFVDGLPVTSRKGHGYGSQSIRYMTERLGGNCQFTIQNNYFVTRVII